MIVISTEHDDRGFVRPCKSKDGVGGRGPSGEEDANKLYGKIRQMAG